MKTKYLLDPSYLLDARSFAIHIAGLAEGSHPLGVPAAWLWEVLSERYSLLDLADAFLYYGDSLDRCLNHPINDPVFGGGHAVGPDAALTLLIAGSKLGYVVPVAEKRSIEFLKDADWASYLGKALGENWEELTCEKPEAEEIWSTAKRCTKRELSLTNEDLDELYARNRNFTTRRAHEYHIYNYLRRLSVIMGETLTFLNAGKSLSTASPATFNMIIEDLKSGTGIFQPPSSLPFQPLIQKVIFRKDALVKDVFAVVETRRLSDLLGGPDEFQEVIFGNIRHRTIAKRTALYLLGLVPIIGYVATGIEGLELIKEIWKSLHEGKKTTAGDLLYHSAKEWVKPALE